MKADSLEGDPPLRRGEGDGSLGIPNVALLGKQLEDPLRRPEGGLELGVETAEGADRSGHGQGVEQERDQFAGGQGTRQHLPAPDPHHHRQGCVPAQRHEG